MSFPRHREIYPSDGGAGTTANAPAHRLDEFPAGYSLAGWSPPEPASASPAGHQYAVMPYGRSRDFHRTANSVLTVCLTVGGRRTSGVFARNLFLGQRIPLAGVAHQSGTIRFSHDPGNSALDVDCRAHEVDNLYVVDASFFPSSAAVNPGLTVMANALRVGDHLLQRLHQLEGQE